MAQNVNEAVVAVTGSINSFPLDEVLEYGVNGELPASTIEHGFANEDGVNVAGSRTTTNINAWQNATLVRTVVTEASVTYTFTLMQTNDDNAELYFGAAKNPVTGAFHWDPSRTGGRRQFVIDVIDEAVNKKLRYYIPNGEVTEVGEQTFASASNLGYTVTITAYKVDVEGDEPANTLIWTGTPAAPAS